MTYTYLYHGFAFGDEHIINVGISRLLLLQMNYTSHENNLFKKTKLTKLENDFDTSALMWCAFATTYLNQGVTLTFDLQHLTRSSVGAGEYVLSVLSKLFLVTTYDWMNRTA